MFSFPSTNTSLACSAETPCYLDGLCEPSRFTEAYNYSVCICPYRNPLDRCESTLFDVLGEINIFLYTGIGLVVFSVFAMLFALELAVDLRFGKRSIPMISKSSLLLFTLLRVAHFSMWTYSMNHGMFPQLPVVDTIFRSLGVICLGTVGYLVICIAWCDMLLKAKNLGDRSKRVCVIRWILVAVVSSVTPVSVAINILTTAIPTLTALALVGNFVGLIAVVTAIGTTIYLLVVVNQWTRELAKINGASASRRIRHIAAKNKFLIGNSIVLIFTMVLIIVFSSIPRDLPHLSIIAESATRLIEIASLFCLFGFLETYMFAKDGWPLTGYYYGILAHESIKALFTVSSGSKQKTPPSGRNPTTVKSQSDTKTTSDASDTHIVSDSSSTQSEIALPSFPLHHE